MDPDTQRALEIMAALRHDAMLVKPDAWDTDISHADATTQADSFACDDRWYPDPTETPARLRERCSTLDRAPVRKARRTFVGDWMTTGATVAVWVALGVLAASAGRTALDVDKSTRVHSVVTVEVPSDVN